MLGISVVTPQCLTVGKAGLATNHTPLTAMLVFCCSHPVELQQQQQKGLEAKDSTFKYYSIPALSANGDQLVPIREL